jgi:hypothetical protein
VLSTLELLPDDGKPGTIRFVRRISNDKRAGLPNLASFQVVAHPEGGHYQALRDFGAVTEDS